MEIWANNITNLTDARYFAAYNAAWVGFCFDKNSPNHIAPNVAAGIAGWLEGPAIAGSFGINTDTHFIKNIAQSLNLQAIILNKNHNISDLQSDLRDDLHNLPIFFELGINDFKTSNFLTFLENNKHAKGFIFNFNQENNQKNNNENNQADINWAQIFASEIIDFDAFKKSTKEFSIYLNLNFNLEIIQNIQKYLPDLKGIVLQGSEEEAVGVKSFEDLDEILEEIEN